MRPQWLGFGLLTLALGVLGPRPTQAAETEVSPTAVLGVEAIDAPPSLADDIAEQLRQKVAASRDMQLVSGKDLVEVKLVFSCADEAAQCMAQAGKSLDAHKLIYGSVKKNGDEYGLWLKMFDVRKAKIDFWLTEVIPKKAADAAGVKAAAGRWFSKLTGRPVNAGAVQVSSNVFGAKVFLDGNHIGVSSEQPLTVADVAAGKHEISAEKPGYAAAKQQFLVANGATAAVQLTMQAAGTGAVAEPSGTPSRGPGTPDPGLTPGPGVNLGNTQAADTSPGSGDGPGGYRTGFWITLAAGLLSAGAAVKFGLDVRDVNERLDPFRRFPCMGNQQCDGNGMVKAGPTATLTKDEQDKKTTLIDEGKRAQTLQWICVGLGSALGVASGYLFYKGYLDSDDGRATHEARRGLRIFPTAAASSGGILAEFEF
jgi:hypothetical protein